MMEQLIGSAVLCVHACKTTWKGTNKDPWQNASNCARILIGKLQFLIWVSATARRGSFTKPAAALNDALLFHRYVSWSLTFCNLLSLTAFLNVLSQEKCSGFAALAFTKHLMGDLDEAIDFYHQALSCKPDDPFSLEMLNKALQEALSKSLNIGEDENNSPEDQPAGIRGGPGTLKSKLARDMTFLSNANMNASTSMASDDGLNISAESDVDMSVA